MLLSLATWLQTLGPEFGFLRVVQYITFRAVMAAMTSLMIGLVAGPWVIHRLTELKIGQPVRGYGMQSHLSKSGTPTMGGVLVLIAIAVSTLLWFDWTNRFVWIVLAVTLGDLAVSAQGRHFADVDALNGAVLEALAAAESVLVKGSRFMKMERVVQAIASHAEQQQKESRDAR